MNDNYLKVNKDLWNKKTDIHVESKFYDLSSFMDGNSSLNEIELSLLGDVRGMKILHLQCHFGLDTISMSRMGAKCTGIDISDVAIDKAIEIADNLNEETQFIVSDVYDLPNHLNEKFDIVYTSYGTIGWLPDMNKWAEVISHFLKPNGKFVFVEFHPFIWMHDDAFSKINYDYFNTGEIIEEEIGTYTDGDAQIKGHSISWNHSIGEVVNSLVNNGIEIKDFQEYNYSPYDCFQGLEEKSPNKYQYAHIHHQIPMVYSIVGKMKRDDNI